MEDLLPICITRALWVHKWEHKKITITPRIVIGEICSRLHNLYHMTVITISNNNSSSNLRIIQCRVSTKTFMLLHLIHRPLALTDNQEQMDNKCNPLYHCKVTHSLKVKDSLHIQERMLLLQEIICNYLRREWAVRDHWLAGKEHRVIIMEMRKMIMDIMKIIAMEILVIKKDHPEAISYMEIFLNLVIQADLPVAFLIITLTQIKLATRTRITEKLLIH